jgi:hypothetical protein
MRDNISHKISSDLTLKHQLVSCYNLDRHDNAVHDVAVDDKHVQRICSIWVGVGWASIARACTAWACIKKTFLQRWKINFWCQFFQNSLLKNFKRVKRWRLNMNLWKPCGHFLEKKTPLIDSTLYLCQFESDAHKSVSLKEKCQQI